MVESKEEMMHTPHGTPLVDTPQTVKELYKWASAKFEELEARLDAKDTPAEPAPADDEPPAVV